jgi:hypothetical protein
LNWDCCQWEGKTINDHESFIKKTRKPCQCGSVHPGVWVFISAIFGWRSALPFTPATPVQIRLWEADEIFLFCTGLSYKVARTDMNVGSVFLDWNRAKNRESFGSLFSSSSLIVDHRKMSKIAGVVSAYQPQYGLSRRRHGFEPRWDYYGWVRSQIKFGHSIGHSRNLYSQRALTCQGALFISKPGVEPASS